MASIDLARMVKRVGKTRAKTILLNPIVPTNAQVIDLAALTIQPARLWLTQKSDILEAYTRALASSMIGDAAVRDDTEEITRALGLGDLNAGRLLITLGPKVTTWIRALDLWHRRRFSQAILTPTGVDLATILGPETETMAAFHAEMMGLITSVSDDTRARISGVVWRGFQARTPRRQIAKEISEAVDISRKRALRIATVSTTQLAARLDQARAEDVGLKEFIWRHSHKKHPRPEHVAHDGITYKWRGDPRLAGDLPGIKPFCGCKGQSVLSLD